MPMGAMVPAGASECTHVLASGRASAEMPPTSIIIQRRHRRNAAKWGACQQRHLLMLPLVGGISVVIPIDIATRRRHFGGCSSTAMVLRGSSTGAHQMKKVGDHWTGKWGSWVGWLYVVAGPGKDGVLCSSFQSPNGVPNEA